MPPRNSVGERMTKLETTTDYIKEIVDEIKHVMNENIKQSKKEIDSFRKESDERYASKLSERIVYAMAGATGLAVLSGILLLVIN